MPIIVIGLFMGPRARISVSTCTKSHMWKYSKDIKTKWCYAHYHKLVLLWLLYDLIIVRGRTCVFGMYANCFLSLIWNEKFKRVWNFPILGKTSMISSTLHITRLAFNDLGNRLIHHYNAFLPLPVLNCLCSW